MTRFSPRVSRLSLAGLTLTVASCLAGLPACSGAASGSASGSDRSASSPDDVAGSRAAPRRVITPRELVQRSKPAIVRIDVSGSAGAGTGTGFVISPDGLVVTNLHVIIGAEDVNVTLPDGTSLPLVQVAAFDADRDLAVIAVRTPQKLPTLALGDSDAVSAGDPVIAIGNPLGVYDYSVSDGLISAVRPLSDKLTVLQISAPISQGSSGGPLFNDYGEVIGVATAMAGQGQNLNFGIPSNYLRPLLAKNDGLTLAALSDELQKRFGQLQGRPSGGTSRIQRRIPEHDLAILDGCSDRTIREAVDAISSAISNGAPLYNEGNHEACFRIYEGAAIRLEQELQCQGLREALGQGLLRAGTEEGYTLKAWAMRDAFDGILLVVDRKYQGQP